MDRLKVVAFVLSRSSIWCAGFGTHWDRTGKLIFHLLGGILIYSSRSAKSAMVYSVRDKLRQRFSPGDSIIIILVGPPILQVALAGPGCACAVQELLRFQLNLL